MIHGSGLKVMTDTTMIDRLKQFVESEMRSCSMDIGGIYTTIRLQDVGWFSGYRRYRHCDGRGKKEDIIVLLLA